MSENDGAGVTYTVKELISMLERTLTDQISGIDRRLTKIDQKLDDKATNDRVRVLEERVGQSERKILQLELTAASSSGASGVKMWAGNAAVLLAASCIGALLYFIVQGAHS